MICKPLFVLFQYFEINEERSHHWEWTQRRGQDV
jgi:hypothetical protein